MLHDPGSPLRFPNRKGPPVPALPPYIIEPTWEQLAVLLPDREANHPLGCHRPNVPGRLVVEKLVQVLVFGCAYEWIEAGVIDALRKMTLDAYDRIVGPEPSELAVDCCITKAPCGVVGRADLRLAGALAQVGEGPREAAGDGGSDDLRRHE